MKRLWQPSWEPNRSRPDALHGAKVAAMLVCLSVVYPLANSVAYCAEPSTGLVISRDGANVNVSLDSEASSSVSIRRSDDVMMIRLPKSFSPKLVIDPALRKENVVEEVETPEGHMITISSQQIYLMTKESLEVPPPVGNPRKAAPAMQAAVDTDVARKDSIKPVNLGGKNLTALEKEKTTARNAEKPAVLGGPIGAARIGPELAEAIARLQQETQSPVTDQTGAKKSDEKASLKAKETPEATPQFAGLGKPAAATDPESQPLDFSGHQQAVALQGSTGGLMRIAFSLLTVLALFAAFAKLVLPKMIERYPDFFENLKRQGEERGKNAAQKQAFHQSSGRNPGFLAPVPSGKDSKKNYLERLNLNGDRFNVLTSTPLGKGKELHLVEIRGRQFVVATTPYTVSLLTDLTDEAADSTSDLHDGPDAELYAHETLDGEYYEDREYGEIHAAEPARIGTHETRQTAAVQPQYEQPYQAAQPVAYAPPLTETVAYLSDETPTIPSVKANPYAARPESSINRQQVVRQQTLQRHAQVEQTYQKYLDTPVTASSPVTAQTPAKPAAPAQEEAAYVEAEEVVVLQDYDDTFGY